MDQMIHPKILFLSWNIQGLATLDAFYGLRSNRLVFPAVFYCDQTTDAFICRIPSKTKVVQHLSAGFERVN